MDDSPAPQSAAMRNLPKTAKEFPINFAVFGLARTHRAVVGAMLSEVGLYLGQEILLMQLDLEVGQSQKCLRDLLCVDHSTIAKSVARLEKAGLVARRKAEYDERVSLITLTETGAELRQRVIEIWSRLEAIISAELTLGEQNKFIALADKLAASLEI